MWVRYFVPEDGDDANHPNVFFVQNNSLTLGELKQAFPLRGSFEFRVLKQVGSRSVWFDLSAPGDAVAAPGQSVFLKASRVLTSPTAVPAQTTPVVQSPPEKPQRATAPPVKVKEEGLLDFDDGPTVQAPTSVKSTPSPLVQPAKFDDDLLGLSSSSTSSQNAPANAFSADPFGLHTLQPTTPTTGTFSPGVSTNPLMTNTGSARAAPMSKPVDPFASMSAAPANPMLRGTGGVGVGGAPMNAMNPLNAQRGAAFDPFGGLGQAQQFGQQGQQRRF